MASRLYSAPKPYLGIVATCGHIPNSINAGINAQSGRQFHYACDEIRSLQFVYPNFYMSAATPPLETGPGTATIESSAEYPLGTRFRVTFSGVNQGSPPSGGLLVSDPVSISIPEGAIFASNSWYSNASGIIFCSDSNTGNQLSTGNGQASLVMSGTPGNSGSSYGPVAIITQTTKGAVGLIGDSKTIGKGDNAATDTMYRRGYFAKGLPGVPTINLGVESDLAASFATANSTNRQALLAYVTHIISGYGVNDTAFSTAAQIHGFLQTIFGLPNLAGKPTWQATFEPYFTTGPYTSDGVQTPNASNTKIQQFNATLRGGINKIQGIIDVAMVLESKATQGVWQNQWGSALTADGVHANTQGNFLVTSSGVISPGLILR